MSQLPESSKGLVERLESFPSDFIEDRHVDIWLPEDYPDHGSYGVIYMHDGQMLFDSTHTWNHQEWHVDEVLSEMIDSQLVDPVIVVGIHNSDTRHADYFPQKPFEILPADLQKQYTQNAGQRKSLFPEGPQSDAYLSFIVQELKPFIDKTYKTKSSARYTHIMGSSMGGLISMYALWEYPEVFGSAACLSTHWIGGYSDRDNPIPAAFLHYMTGRVALPTSHRLWFDHGTEGLDSSYGKHQQRVDAMLLENGYIQGKNLSSKVYEGADHNEKAWSDRLHEIFAFLLR